MIYDTDLGYLKITTAMLPQLVMETDLRFENKSSNLTTGLFKDKLSLRGLYLSETIPRSVRYFQYFLRIHLVWSSYSHIACPSIGAEHCPKRLKLKSSSVRRKFSCNEAKN